MLSFRKGSNNKDESILETTNAPTDHSKAPSSSAMAWLRAMTVVTTLLVLLLLYRIRFTVSLYPNVVVDAEQKEPNGYWDTTDVALACFVPAVAYALRRPITAWWIRQPAVRLRCLLVLYVSLTAAIAYDVTHTPHCPAGTWMATDVGAIPVLGSTASSSWCLRTLCDGRVWEPHVVQAIETHLFGQGRAMDVGAFAGYHTLRLAQRAAPHTVYAWEGRLGAELEKTLRKNNAQHAVRVLSDVIGADWVAPTDLRREWLDTTVPLSFIKLDCEGCELAFLRGMRDVLLQWHPVIVVEIQDDASRRKAVLGGQQMIRPVGTRAETIAYLRDELGYANVTPLLDTVYGKPTWDYLAVWQD